MRCSVLLLPFLIIILFPPLQVSDSPVLLEALAEHLPLTFAAGKIHSLPSMNGAGSSKQTGSDSDDQGEGVTVKVVVKEQQEQETSGVVRSSDEESGEKSPGVAKNFPNETTKKFTCGKVRRDVVLFCRVNSKEPYVFMGRSLPAPPFSSMSHFVPLFWIGT